MSVHLFSYRHPLKIRTQEKEDGISRTAYVRPTCTRPFAPYIRVETRIEFLLRRYRTLCEREPCLAARESLNSDPLLYRVELELLCGVWGGVWCVGRGVVWCG